MALSDDVVVKGLTYLTDIPMTEVSEIEKKIKTGENPITFKKKLAFEVVKQLNTDDQAKKAQAEFERVVQGGEIPQNIDEREVGKDRLIDADFLVELGLASSKSDAKRMFEQDGVELDGQKIRIGEALMDESGEGLLLKVGKKILKLKVS
jgi:tyrosyl-tRNA synthetase